jgi:hypothetical protein
MTKGRRVAGEEAWVEGEGSRLREEWRDVESKWTRGGTMGDGRAGTEAGWYAGVGAEARRQRRVPKTSKRIEASMGLP